MIKIAANYNLSRHCARYIYVVPDGLKELMSDISREVIRSNPENIYTFIADYLDALLITRENARVAARLVQSITEIATTTVEFLLKTGMDREDADKVIAIIQKSFGKRIRPEQLEADSAEITDDMEEVNVVSDIIDQADIPPEIGEEAAKIIQNAYRAFKARRDKERELLSGMVDWRVAARSAIRLYRKTGVTYEEANRAATLIKAAYKGYYTRRIMRKLAEESRQLAHRFDEEELEEEEAYDERDDQKNVKIDYASIIPHVDFDEPMTEGESTDASLTPPETKKEESSTSTIVYAVTEEILNLTLEEITLKESQLVAEEAEEKEEEEEPEPQEPEVSKMHEEEEAAPEEKKEDIEPKSEPAQVKEEIQPPEVTGDVLEKIEEVGEAEESPPQPEEGKELEEQVKTEVEPENEQAETGQVEAIKTDDEPASP